MSIFRLWRTRSGANKRTQPCVFFLSSSLFRGFLLIFTGRTAREQRFLNDTCLSSIFGPIRRGNLPRYYIAIIVNPYEHFGALDPLQVAICVTYVWTREGWLYCAAILDLFNQKIVGWHLSDRLSQDLVLPALENAIKRHNLGCGLILRSDRASQIIIRTTASHHHCICRPLQYPR